MGKFKEFYNERQEEKRLDDLIDKAIDETPDSDILIDAFEDESVDESEMLFEGGNVSSPFSIEGEDLYFGGIGDELTEEIQDVRNGDYSVDESATTDELEGRRGNKSRTSQEVRDMAAQYKMVPDNSSESGYTLHRKHGRFNPDRHELSTNKRETDNKSEIDDIIAQLNRPSEVHHFDFNDEGEITKDGRSLNKREKTKWIHVLNDINRKIFPDIFYTFNVFDRDENGKQFFVTDKDGNEVLGNVIYKNKTKLLPDKDHEKLLDKTSSEYVPLDDKDKEMIISILSRKASKARKDDGVYGWDEKSKCFTVNGQKIVDKKQLLKLVDRLNGGVKQSDNSRWDHFVFAKEGSKIGKHTGSFSLPPIESCVKGVPCAHQGCYAVKSYSLRPMVAAGWDNNLAMLREGKFEQFINEAVDFINNKKLTHFRFHVSGDIYEGGDKYVDAILQVCNKCPNVKFWTYTKNYDAFRGKSAKNLVVIMSAWGEFQPPDDMLKTNPVAFLYDESDPEITRYVPEISKKDGDGGLQICPCTIKNNPEHVTCESCEICFSRKAYNNLAFNKH